MLALRLLLPVISPDAAEAILGAVLERSNTTGALCHEETIGDYASFVNMQNNQSNLGNTPSYSYIMLDTDFLLLPVFADYATMYANRTSAFLNQTSTLVNGSFSTLLQQNVNHVLNLSMAFGLNATQSNLVPIRDPNVGDWRDSETGLGYGIIPFDVNSESNVPPQMLTVSRPDSRRSPRDRESRQCQRHPRQLLCHCPSVRPDVGNPSVAILRSLYLARRRERLAHQLRHRSESLHVASVRRGIAKLVERDTWVGRGEPDDRIG